MCSAASGEEATVETLQFKPTENAAAPQVQTHTHTHKHNKGISSASTVFYIKLKIYYKSTATIITQQIYTINMVTL